MNELRIDGIADLREDYSHPHNKKYYVILSLSMTLENRFAPGRVSVQLPITELYYRSLKEELEESKAEAPILQLKGNLEIKLSV